jgi:hypothetical protein
MNDTHDQFLKKVHEYFKLNQTWEARREEIQAVRAVKPKTKSPKYRQSLLKDQKDIDTN